MPHHTCGWNGGASAPPRQAGRYAAHVGLRGRPRLLALDARRFDDGPPLLDLRLLQSAESFRSLLIEGRSFDAEVGQASPHLRDAHRVPDGGVESGDDIPRSPFGRPKPVPDRKVEL